LFAFDFLRLQSADEESSLLFAGRALLTYRDLGLACLHLCHVVTIIDAVTQLITEKTQGTLSGVCYRFLRM